MKKYLSLIFFCFFALVFALGGVLLPNNHDKKETTQESYAQEATDENSDEFFPEENEEYSIEVEENEEEVFTTSRVHELEDDEEVRAQAVYSYGYFMISDGNGTCVSRYGYQGNSYGTYYPLLDYANDNGVDRTYHTSGTYIYNSSGVYLGWPSANTGYTFDYWEFNGSRLGTNEYFNMTSAQTTRVNHACLYAYFKVATYTISYTMNGGSHSGSYATQFTYSTSSQTASIGSATRTGYTLYNRTTSAGTISGSTLNIPASRASGITVTFNWYITLTIVTGNSSAGTVSGTTSYSTNSSVAIYRGDNVLKISSPSGTTLATANLVDSNHYYFSYWSNNDPVSTSWTSYGSYSGVYYYYKRFSSNVTITACFEQYEMWELYFRYNGYDAGLSWGSAYGIHYVESEYSYWGYAIRLYFSAFDSYGEIWAELLYEDIICIYTSFGASISIYMYNDEIFSFSSYEGYASCDIIINSQDNWVYPDSSYQATERYPFYYIYSKMIEIPISRRVYNINYTYNSGTRNNSVSWDSEYLAGTSSQTKSIGSVYRTGYDGSASANNGCSISGTTLTIPSWTYGTITVTYSWTPKTISVTFDANGGSGGPGTLYYKYGTNTYYTDSACTSVATLTNRSVLVAIGGQSDGITEVSYSGYTFQRYYGSGTNGAVSGKTYATKTTNKTGSITNWTYSYNIESSLCTDAYGNTILYAEWTANNYTVSYNANGGSGSVASQTVTFNTTFTTRANGFTRTGYTFNGWGTSAGAAHSKYPNANTTYTYTTVGGTTLYARWTPNSYWIQFGPNGGSFNGSTTSTTITQEYGTTYTAGLATRTGYTFAGWAFKHASPTDGYTDGYGRGLYSQSVFEYDNSSIGVYNNNGNGTVTHSRVSDSSNPMGSGYSLRITTSGSASPGAGGFYTNTYSKANGLFYQVVVAKIPVGYYMYSAANARSNNPSEAWYNFRTMSWESGECLQTEATSGTGTWKTYIYRLQCSDSGNFSTFTHKYLVGPDNTSVTWYVGYSQVFDATGVGDFSPTANTTYHFGAGNGTLLALWTPNSYTVTFNGNGADGGSTSDKWFYYDRSDTLPANGFTRTGYSFAGWATSANASVAYNDGGTVSNLTTTHRGTYTLYAKWNINSYYIDLNAYHPNGNLSGALPSDATCDFVVNGTTNSKIGDYYSAHNYGSTYQITAVYYDSAKYSVSYDSSQHTLGAGAESIAITFTLNSYWTNINIISPGGSEDYASGTVTIDYNGTVKNGQTNEESIYIPYGGYISVSNIAPATGMHLSNVTGHTTQSGGTYTYTVTGTGAINVYMAWNTYTVVFNGNGNTGGSTANQGFTYNTADYLRANGFTKTGYHFAGWATSAGGNAVYSNQQSVSNLTSTHGGTFNLYAKWEANSYTVHFNGNGNTGGSTADQGFTYDSAQNLRANGFTKTGYYFNGWATSASGSAEYSNGQSVSNLTSTHGGTVNLFATWAPNGYTITYSPNGGSGSNQTQAVTYDAGFTTKASDTFSRTGYRFAGWGGSYPNASTSYTYTTASDTTLYAQWTANTYTVHFNGNGNTGGSTADQGFTYDSAQGLRANGFTKTGYSFNGWATSSGGIAVYSNGQSVSNLTSTHGATFNLYATWAPNNYTVTYNVNGGEQSNITDNVTYDSNFTTRGVYTFTRMGYVLTGWSGSYPNPSTTYKYITDGNTTLTAVWADTWLNHTSTPTQTGSVYQVSTGTQLAWIAYQVNVNGNTSIKFTITDTIDLSSYYWYPIGTSTYKFTGECNGQYRIIDGLHTLSNTNGGVVGLFGWVGNGAIIQQTYVRTTGLTGDSCSGGIAGRVDGGAQFIKNIVEGNIYGGDYVGSFVGYYSAGSRGTTTVIKESLFRGQIASGSTRGILVGYAQNVNVKDNLVITSNSVGWIGASSGVDLDSCLKKVGDTESSTSGSFANWSTVPSGMIASKLPKALMWIAQAS